MELKQETLLVIAPHADDEILGCCGLINKVKENGGKVFVHVLSIGGFNKIGFGKIEKESWKAEFLKVIKFLKIDGYDISYFEDKNFLKLDTIPQAELINKIELKSKVSLSKIKPTIVAIPTVYSYHQDHIATYKASIAALRVRPQISDFVAKTVISYESSEYSHWSPYSETGSFSPNLFFNMSKKEIDKKITALSLYKSQLRKGHRDKNSIIKLSQIRGLEIGVDFAEAYHLHRLFF
jgi:LmbE family N-acetylglucosaminyl deacetylase